jgi:hypothetical protein
VALPAQIKGRKKKLLGFTLLGKCIGTMRRHVWTEKFFYRQEKFKKSGGKNFYLAREKKFCPNLFREEKLFS